jgi:anti-sigma factor RsiW
MTPEPVNSDDPTLTAYLLGELTSAERAEFEAKLERSPQARCEMESMEAVMDALSLGLREEWKTGLKVPALAVLPSNALPEVVVPGRFRAKSKPALAVAAVLAATLAVLGAIVSMRGATESLLYVDVPASEREPAISVDNTGSTYEARLAVAVPQLFLTEEVATAPHADLATTLASLDESVTSVDASYLESRLPDIELRAVKQGLDAFANIERASLLDDARPDSYLPPTTLGASGSAMAAGFHTVSYVAEPVLEAAETDLRLVSDFQSIQNDLAELLERLPAASPERAGLESLLERSRSVLHELKSELAR